MGASAGVYVAAWTQPEHILAAWATWLYSLRDRFIDKSTTDTERFNRERITAQILKPLLTCGFCAGAHWGLWSTVWITHASPLPLMLYIGFAGVASLIGGLIDNLILPK